MERSSPSPRMSFWPSDSCLFLVAACLLFSGVSSAAPWITLSKKSGPPTSQILVSGRGFEPNVGVDIYFGTKDEALAVTNSKGEFRNAKIHAPRNAHPGQHWVTALERNNDKGAQRQFLVQTNWSQYRFSPIRNGVNPFENVLNPHTVDNLGVKWIYNTQHLYAWGSPIVVDGRVYVATSVNLYALDAKSGSLLWEFSLFPELLSSDPTLVNGVLYVGTFDEGIYALEAKTGKKLWNYACGGAYCRVFSAPVVANGIVYYDNAENDEGDGVYAVDAKTGKLLWFSGTYSSSSSPAVANGVLYVGTDESDFYALDAFTGAKLWTFTAGWSVRSTPVVANGVVYFGSLDKNVYALNASTGKKLWSYATPGEIDSSAAVENGVAYIGSGDGTLYALNAYSGKLLWGYPTGALALNNPTVTNGVVYFGTWYPDALYALEAVTGKLLWSYASGGGIVSDAAVVNGTVYMSSYNDGLIYAFDRANSVIGQVEQESPSSSAPDLTTLRPDWSLRVSNPSAMAVH